MSRKSKERQPSRKRTTDEEDRETDEFMRRTKVSIVTELDERPSLEEHGFWIYPIEYYEDVRPKTKYMMASEMTVPMENLTAPTSFMDINRMNRSPTCSTSHVQPSQIGPCYCNCHQWNSFPCFMTGCQTYEYMMQMQQSMEINRQNQFQTRKRKKTKCKTDINSPPTENTMDKEVENNVMKDYELASMYVNDAEHNFDDALKEQ